MRRLPDTYFADMYAQNPDPWDFDKRWYERRKRALTIAMLPRERFRHAFEPGCSIGTLTEVLAARCDRVTATDVVDEALSSARARLTRVGYPDVSFTRWALGDPWPEDRFDLIILSEVCYYLEPAELARTLDNVVMHLEPDGVLLAAHWRHPVADYPMTGDQVHQHLSKHVGLTSTAGYADPDVLIETFAPAAAPQVSIAQREGITD